MDFYWGMELYPRIFGFDIKHYISCRVSMTAWPLLLISYAMAEVSELGTRAPNDEYVHDWHPAHVASSSRARTFCSTSAITASRAA